MRKLQRQPGRNIRQPQDRRSNTKPQQRNKRNNQTIPKNKDRTICFFS
jgi:hypothetical protein